MCSAVSVLGVGTAAGADDVGWRVVEHLHRRFPDGPGRWLSCRRVMAELMVALATAPAAVIVDAACAGGRSGEIYRLTTADLTRLPRRFISSHGLSVAEALALAGALEQVPPELLIYGVEMGAPPRTARLKERVVTALAAEIQAVITAYQRTGRLRFPLSP